MNLSPFSAFIKILWPAIKNLPKFYNLLAILFAVPAKRHTPWAWLQLSYQSPILFDMNLLALKLKTNILPISNKAQLMDINYLAYVVAIAAINIILFFEVLSKLSID